MSARGRVVVALEGPHLEPFEAVLDALEDHDADVLLGPALLLGVGPSASLYLQQCGIRAWLDSAAVVTEPSALAMARVVRRVRAAGLVVAAGTSNVAIAAMVRELGPAHLLVRCRVDDVTRGVAAAALGASARGVVLGLADAARLGDGAAIPAGALWLEREADGGEASGVDSLSGAGCIDHSIARADDPAQALVHARAMLASWEQA